MYSVLEQHTDGCWWYHRGETYETKKEADDRGRELYGSGRYLKPRPYVTLEHKKPFPQDIDRCTRDFVNFNFAGGYLFSLKDEEGGAL